ncbi:hypothetical protein RFI_28226 [Reticulomyxa filosa]|uniref:Uncharacterized protein n=1 Tax=Reticulomyxa filosa TaxID=46433 RepID=X6M5A4_RETFI|nr:hypothetical protein RFI_28226 [Reticulomyxa filosa]|eukprot:ETO09163.1 hypothetical protein RFI_28226 [Reticulomyxa filosa]
MSIELSCGATMRQYQFIDQQGKQWYQVELDGVASAVRSAMRQYFFYIHASTHLAVQTHIPIQVLDQIGKDYQCFVQAESLYSLRVFPAIDSTLSHTSSYHKTQIQAQIRNSINVSLFFIFPILNKYYFCDKTKQRIEFDSSWTRKAVEGFLMPMLLKIQHKIEWITNGTFWLEKGEGENNNVPTLWTYQKRTNDSLHLPNIRDVLTNFLKNLEKQSFEYPLDQKLASILASKNSTLWKHISEKAANDFNLMAFLLTENNRILCFTDPNAVLSQIIRDVTPDKMTATVSDDTSLALSSSQINLNYPTKPDWKEDCDNFKSFLRDSTVNIISLTIGNDTEATDERRKQLIEYLDSQSSMYYFTTFGNEGSENKDNKDSADNTTKKEKLASDTLVFYEPVARQKVDLLAEVLKLFGVYVFFDDDSETEGINKLNILNNKQTNKQKKVLNMDNPELQHWSQLALMERVVNYLRKTKEVELDFSVVFDKETKKLYILPLVDQDQYESQSKRIRNHNDHRDWIAALYANQTYSLHIDLFRAKQYLLSLLPQMQVIEATPLVCRYLTQGNIHLRDEFSEEDPLLPSTNMQTFLENYYDILLSPSPLSSDSKKYKASVVAIWAEQPFKYTNVINMLSQIKAVSFKTSKLLPSLYSRKEFHQKLLQWNKRYNLLDYFFINSNRRDNSYNYCLLMKTEESIPNAKLIRKEIKALEMEKILLENYAAVVHIPCNKARLQDIAQTYDTQKDRMLVTPDSIHIDPSHEKLCAAVILFLDHIKSHSRIIDLSLFKTPFDTAMMHAKRLAQKHSVQVGAIQSKGIIGLYRYNDIKVVENVANELSKILTTQTPKMRAIAK